MSEKVPIRARHREELGVKVLSCRKLFYDDGADPDQERPHNVRAGSGLASVDNQLMAVQDDADFLVLIEPETGSVRGFPIPAGEDSHRLYDDRDHTADVERKLDLEVCITLPAGAGAAALAIGSGVCSARKRMVLVRFDSKMEFEELNTSNFHDALAASPELGRSGLNIEGAAIPPGGTILFFSRGDQGEEPVDAIFTLSLKEFLDYLEEPKNSAPEPTSTKIYDLGGLDDRKLTFSDAEPWGDVVLFTASSEGDNRAGGSLLGFVTGEEAFVATGEGLPIKGKIEGITRLASDPHRLFLIEDQDDIEKASRLYEIELTGPWPERVTNR